MQRPVVKKEVSAQTIMEGTLFLEYQPTIDLRVNEVLFFEGLARISIEGNQVLVAGEFLSKLQNTEMLRVLNERVLDRLARDLARNANYRASINVQTNSLFDRSWQFAFDRLVSIFADTPGRLLVEIDEQTATAVPELTADFINTYEAKGILFVLDNFGKNETSLKNLVKMNFDILKIDEYFVRNIEKNADKQVMVRAIKLISDELDMVCVCEKVETKDELETIQGLGLTFAQGNVFGKPRSIDVMQAIGRL